MFHSPSRLEIAATDSGIPVRIPVPAGPAAVLEAREGFGPGTSWREAAVGPPPAAGTHVTFSDGLSAGARFYRLKSLSGE